MSQKIVSPQEGAGFALWICGLFLIPITWHKFQTNRQFNLMISEFERQSVAPFIEYAYGMCWAIKHRDDPNNLLALEGVLSLHIEQCLRPPELCSCELVRSKLIHRPESPSKEEEIEEEQLWFDFLRN